MKFATAATPTSHHMRTNAGKTGMKEVARPLESIRNENKRMDLFLPQISETIPATNVPTAKPEKKIIFEMTGRLLEPQTRSHSEVIVSSQKLSSYEYWEQLIEQLFCKNKSLLFIYD